MECIGLGEDIFGECGGDLPRDLVAVDGGESFSVGVTSSGEVIGWGSAFYGELGVESTDGKSRPERVRSPPASIPVPLKCASVACGLNHVLALSVDGRVVAWGRNDRGQASVSPDEVSIVFPPKEVVFSQMEQPHIVKLAAGGSHSLAIDTAGSLWSWGDNSHGQLGVPNIKEYTFDPRQVNFPKGARVRSVAAGYAHSASISSDGEVFTFGWGLYHQLGHGSTDDVSSPQLIAAFDGIDGGMLSVACGTWHSMGISCQGDIYSWGWGPDGQLGPSQRKHERLPRVVDTEDDYFLQENESNRAIQVTCGSRFSMAVSKGGKLFCWGRWKDEIASSTEIQLRQKKVVQVSLGHSHALLFVHNY